jgi:hypothetical protein
VQLPQEYRETLHLVGRVRLALEESHVSVWPDRPAPARAADPGATDAVGSPATGTTGATGATGATGTTGAAGSAVQTTGSADEELR